MSKTIKGYTIYTLTKSGQKTKFIPSVLSRPQSIKTSKAASKNIEDPKTPQTQTNKENKNALLSSVSPTRSPNCPSQYSQKSVYKVVKDKFPTPSNEHLKNSPKKPSDSNRIFKVRSEYLSVRSPSMEFSPTKDPEIVDANSKIKIEALTTKVKVIGTKTAEAIELKKALDSIITLQNKDDYKELAKTSRNEKNEPDFSMQDLVGSKTVPQEIKNILLKIEKDSIPKSTDGKKNENLDKKTNTKGLEKSSSLALSGCFDCSPQKSDIGSTKFSDTGPASPFQEVDCGFKLEKINCATDRGYQYSDQECNMTLDTTPPLSHYTPRTSFTDSSISPQSALKNIKLLESKVYKLGQEKQKYLTRENELKQSINTMKTQVTNLEKLKAFLESKLEKTVSKETFDKKISDYENKLQVLAEELKKIKENYENAEFLYRNELEKLANHNACTELTLAKLQIKHRELKEKTKEEKCQLLKRISESEKTVQQLLRELEIEKFKAEEASSKVKLLESKMKDPSSYKILEEDSDNQIKHLKDKLACSYKNNNDLSQALQKEQDTNKSLAGTLQKFEISQKAEVESLKGEIDRLNKIVKGYEDNQMSDKKEFEQKKMKEIIERLTDTLREKDRALEGFKTGTGTFSMEKYEEICLLNKKLFEENRMLKIRVKALMAS